MSDGTEDAVQGKAASEAGAGGGRLALVVVVFAALWAAPREWRGRYSPAENEEPAAAEVADERAVVANDAAA